MQKDVGSETASDRTGRIQGGQCPPYSVRDEVTPTDRDAVRGIIARTGFFRPEEVEIAVELVDERLARGAASGYHFVFLESGGKLAGYACYGPTACTQSSFDLYWIAVETENQRCGLGRAIIEEVESRIRRVGGTRIHVDTSGRPQYGPTRAFYERNGYCPEAVLKDFYAPGDDRVIYVKRLA